MAFFRKSKKKKGNEIQEENRIPSAEIAKQRAEDIQTNYDSDTFSTENNTEELSEEPSKSNREPEDLDPLLSGDLDDSMLSFDDDVEKDIENSEATETENEGNEEENNHDFFADVELPDDTNGELSETDSSFEGLYDIDGDTLAESSNAAEIAEDEESASTDVEDIEDDAEGSDDLVKSLSNDIEEQLIEKDEELSPDGMATKSQIYMAMQVFDSETGDFDMKGVDNQLVFDTDDEDSFGFSCHKNEENKPEEFDASSYVFDTSDDD